MEKFLKTSLIGGLLVILPVAILLFAANWLFASVRQLIHPLTAQLVANTAVEDILADLHRAEPDWCLARLRYFNPVGAHESGLIGENPKGIPNNLMPFIAQTAAGLRDELSVFGDDYDTADGTGVRDYIHVVDLANGHVAALDYLQREPGLLTVNLGTGQGVSVLEMIKTFENANHCKVPYHLSERRPGDIARCWADTGLASDLLGWKACRTLKDMCTDSWRWQNSVHGRSPEDKT